MRGWSLPDFDDKQWDMAQRVPLEGNTYIGPMTNGTLNYHNFKLIAQKDPYPTIVKTLKAQQVEEVRPGVFVYDMGQNMVGFPRISLPDGQAGDTVLLRYAEVIYPDLDE